MNVLMETAMFEGLKADVVQHEISTSNLKVKGDAILMKGRSRRIAASPLARLLAEELGLALLTLGRDLAFMPYESHNVSKCNLNSNPLSYIK